MSRDQDTDTASARALFASYDGMEGLSAAAPAAPVKGSILDKAGSYVTRVYPGFTVAVTIGLAATWLSDQYKAPVMLFALLLGMAFHFLHEEGRCIPGIEVSSKTVLRLGVALLGARITAAQIASLGVAPIATVVVAVISTILVGGGLARLLGLRSRFGILSGGSVGICGASAALAIASVLPKDETAERDTIVTVVTVTTLSTVAMVTYPLIAEALGFNHTQAGVFLGGTIHDVAQVVGAGFSISQETGNTATYVKLLRVAMLLPVVFAIAWLGRRGEGGGARPPLPYFLFGFAALVAVNSLGYLPKAATDAASVLSRMCLVTAISALGMKTSFKAVAAVGWRPILLMVLETAWIGCLVAGAVWLTRSGL